MITPNFSLDQTPDQLILTVFAPYTNVKDTEIHVDGDDVRFFSKPYYLRLNLPGRVEETDNSSAKYDADESKFVITLDKETPGEEFKGLDMITTLLQPKEKRKKVNKLVEVMDGDDDEDASSSKMEMQLGDEDWYIEQEVTSEAVGGLLQYGYGFGNNHRGLGSKYDVELGEVSEIKSPDNLSPAQRWEEKEKKEQEKFSDDHYLSDLMLETDIQRIMEFFFDTESLNTLTDANLEQMKNLGNREFLLDKAQQRSLHLGLIDILFAYCYDWRTSEGVHSIESPWNISRVSGTFSWFVTFGSLNDVLVSSLRRSLSYPLYRNWDLSMKVMEDTVNILKSGPRAVLICLLDIHKLFVHRDPYYLLNQLYIEDYAVWIQRVPNETLVSLSNAVEKELATMTKAIVRFDLPELEWAAKLVEDEEMEEELASNVQNINIKK